MHSRGLFARLLQNASIKGGLNSRAKRRGTFPGQIVRHKFVRSCRRTFAPGGTSRCRKLDDKLAIFKYFPLVLANRTKTNESPCVAASSAFANPGRYLAIILFLFQRLLNLEVPVARAVVLVKDFKIVPGFYTGWRDARRFVAVTEKESRQKSLRDCRDYLEDDERYSRRQLENECGC